MTWADGASIRTGTVTHPEMKSCIRGEGWDHRTSEVFVGGGGRERGRVRKWEGTPPALCVGRLLFPKPRVLSYKLRGRKHFF